MKGESSMSLSSRRLRQELPTGSRNSIWYVAAGALALIVAILIAPVSDEMQGRLAVAGIGGIQILLAIVRPPGYWGIVRNRTVSILGDRVAVGLMIIFGLAVAIAALCAPLASIGAVFNHLEHSYQAPL